MTISLVASDAAQTTGIGAAILTLVGTEGNLQVAFGSHRTESLTPTITDDGWSAPFLVETEIANASARRAIVMFWRVVPAAQDASFAVGWDSATLKAAVAYEFATDTAGGAWSFDAPTGRNSNDNGTVDGTSLASNSVTPEFAEAVAVDAVATRHGAPAGEDSYSDSFTAGAGVASGAAASDLACFSGHKIVDVSPAAMSTTASWTTSALATSIIGVWSVDTGAVAPPMYISVTVGPMREPLLIDTMRDPLLAGTISGVEPVTVGALTDTTPTVGVLRDDSSPAVGVLREPLTVGTMRDPVQVDELRE